MEGGYSICRAKITGLLFSEREWYVIESDMKDVI
ncbi:unnamed protein product [Bacillus thuringiensis DB27]|uniref:Uncharacterized protein n=1 Tax=Bacillus thuringiensis DB27 TaxID=1431339 RepID=W8YAP4_BACTU|nr:unnamed protein product [Bacillus thuringiensis DB27]